MYRKITNTENGYYVINGESYSVTIDTYDATDENGKNIKYTFDSAVAYRPLVNNKKADFEYFEEHAQELYENAYPLVAVPMNYHLQSNILILYEDCESMKYLDARKNTEARFFIDKTKEYEEKYYDTARKYVGTDCCSERTFIQRTIKYHPNFSFDRALEYLKANPDMFKLNYLPGHDPSDPVISFSKPNITRKTGNSNKNTFDFVSVEILLRSDLNIKDIAIFTKAHLQEFDSRIREHLDNNKTYQKYGIPVEFLTLYGCATRGKSCLEFKYEIKEI